MAKSVLIAAPSSGSGKTSVTMGLIRALRNQGQNVSSIKIGPDYIDSGWHSMAAGERCWNVDPWAMRESTQNAIINEACAQKDWCIVEGVMGLFDGAIDGRGSSFELAKRFNVPIILVVDASRQADSIAALVSGFNQYNGKDNIAGIILNRVGSQRHDALLRGALAPLRIPVVASLNYSENTLIGSRHLGLFQAGEKHGDETLIHNLGKAIEERLDFQQLENIAKTPQYDVHNASLNPLFFSNKKRIAVAEDAAFRFIYRHFLEGWQRVGAHIDFFSVLKGDEIGDEVDAIFIPGGYPELHLEAISNSKSLKALQKAYRRGVPMYAECGGYMLLGESIIDKDGKHFAMCGILPMKTSFEHPKRALGYRNIEPLNEAHWRHSRYRGHEFHYTQSINSASKLFSASDAKFEDTQHVGDQSANAMGSYLHLIDSYD